MSVGTTQLTSRLRTSSYQRQQAEDRQAALADGHDEHPAQPTEIPGGGEDARVAGDATEQAGPRVVDLAQQDVAAGPLRRRDALAQAMRRVEPGVLQAKRLEDRPIEITVEGLATHPMDDLAQQDEDPLEERATERP